MKSFFSSKNISLIVLIGVVVYLLTHLIGLTKLPVFADEAIYIRWAQLIMDDAPRYLFFPLNDGKTPLFIWQIIPALMVFKDPLFAARLVSVIGGLLEVVAMVWLVKELKGGTKAQLFVAFLVMVLPYWFFHHRMALMDGWLTLWLTLATVALLRAIKTENIWMAVVAGICFGASLLTKVPAVLAVPSMLLLSLTVIDSKKKCIKGGIYAAVALGIGVGMFGALKISPVFSQIFARGSDFLFTTADVERGIWFTTVHNIPSYVMDFWWYATPASVALFVASFFFKKQRKTFILLALSFLAFTLPIALMGKVVYPRYLLPGMIFLTAQIALCAELMVVHKKRTIKWLGVSLLAVALLTSVRFDYALAFSPDTTPFVSADTTQYLTEWSSGHGIYQIDQMLIEQSANQKIAVATEGYFGTLPDGLLMYLHNQNVSNISVDGAGVPITGLPAILIKKKGHYDRYWLVVNSHRKQFDLPSDTLIASYCRPYDAPCLQVWDVTELVKNYTPPSE